MAQIARAAVVAAEEEDDRRLILFPALHEPLAYLRIVADQAWMRCQPRMLPANVPAPAEVEPEGVQPIAAGISHRRSGSFAGRGVHSVMNSS